MAFTIVTVSGTYEREPGVPASGSITFQPVAEMANDYVRAPVPKIAYLNAQGTISIALEATDDPGTLPVGNAYIVTENLKDAVNRAPWLLTVPRASSTLDLKTVQPALAANPAYKYLAAQGDTATGLMTFSAGAVVGVDPGGAQLFRVGGSARITGNLSVAGLIADAGTLNFSTDGAHGYYFGATGGLGLILADAAARIVPGATSFAIRNNANNADNLLVTDAGAVTIRSGLTLSASTVSGAAGQTLNLASAAGQNLALSPGSSGAVYVYGGLYFESDPLSFKDRTNALIVGGSASLSIRNNANTADNLLVADAGAVTVRNGFTLSAGDLNLASGSSRVMQQGVPWLSNGSPNRVVLGSTQWWGIDLLAGNLSSGAENIGVNVPAQTLTATGAITSQRFALFPQHTITASSPQTITTAATVVIAGAPIAAGSAVITNAYALWVQSGASRFDEDISSGKAGTFRINAPSGQNMEINTPGGGTLHLPIMGLRLHGDPGANAGFLGLTDATAIGNGANTNLQAPAIGTGGGPSSLVAAKWLKVYDGTTTRYIPMYS